MAEHASGVDAALVAALTDMGFDEGAAAAALRATGSRNVEAAVLWLCGPDAGGSGDADAALGIPLAANVVEHPDGARTPAWVRGVEGDFKVVLCVVASLHMGAGKVAAQAAHAAVGLYKQLLAGRVPWLGAWKAAGEKTVVLSVDTADAATALQRHAEALGLPSAPTPRTVRSAASFVCLTSRCGCRRAQRTRCWTRAARRSRPARSRSWPSAVRTHAAARREHALQLTAGERAGPAATVDAVTGTLHTLR